MPSKEYLLIPEEGASDGDVTSRNLYLRRTPSSRSFLTGIILFILALSLSANCLWVIQHIRSTAGETCFSTTAYAGLERNVPVAWNHDSDFASHNRTTWDQAWETIDPDAGLVAISDDFVAMTGLHKAQRWPWDNSKGLYLLQGYHNLHCLVLISFQAHHPRPFTKVTQKIIRASLTEMHDKVPQSIHFSHINHCLDAIRQDIICNADDTPRYTGFTHGSVSSGIGQVRMCKNWGKLEQWAEKHSACYRYEPVETPMGIPLDSFKYCPDKSKPWEALGVD